MENEGNEGFALSVLCLPVVSSKEPSEKGAL